MKKLIFALSCMGSLGLFTGCAGEVDKQDRTDKQTTMSIGKYELTPDQQEILQLTNSDFEGLILDFNVDDTVESVHIEIYKFGQTDWETYNKNSYTVEDTQGKIVLQFDNIGERVEITLQEESTSSTNYIATEIEEDLDMAQAMTYLNSPTEIQYEEEIPVIIQIITEMSSIGMSGLETFHTPSIYEGSGYEHIYAVTVTFSQLPVK